MAITRVQAKKLCNAAEMELVGMSLGDALKSLTAVQLRGKVKRARTLRDKSADQFKRQTVATRASTGTKRGNSGAANARTELKLQLFDEVLKRFETRSAQVDAQAARAEAVAARAAAKSAPKATSQGARKPVSKTVSKTAAKTATKTAAKPRAAAPRKPAATKTTVKAAVKAALKSTRKPAVNASQAAPRGSAKSPAVKRSTAVSDVVAVRGKAIGAHARSAQARDQAKRDKR